MLFDKKKKKKLIIDNVFHKKAACLACPVPFMPLFKVNIDQADPDESVTNAVPYELSTEPEFI